MASRSAQTSSKESVLRQKKQRIKTPVLLQMHATECGAACLGSVLAYFGRWVPLTQLREKCEVSRDGSSAASIVRAARHYGLECKGLSLNVDLLKNLSLPLILFWQFSHFVVLEGMSENHFFINDPASGRRKLTKEEFVKSYSGIALQLNPSEDFQPGGQWPNLFVHLKDLLSGTWRVGVSLFACALVMTLLALVIPVSLTVFVDEVMQDQSAWLGVVSALLVAGALVYALSWMKHRILERLSLKISVIGYNESLTKLLRLPLDFFEHRQVGDLTDRVSTIDRLAKNLTTEFLVLLIDIAMSVVLLVAMLLFNVFLALVVVLLALLHGSLTYILNHRQSIQSQAVRREQGLLLAIGMQMLSHAENLRMTGADDRFFARWSGQQARELQARQLNSQLSAINSALPSLISIWRSGAILSIGGVFVISGEMTLGVLVGFYFLAEMFLDPIGRLMEFADKRHTLETDIQRLQDISNTTEDPIFRRRSPDSVSIPTFEGRFQLTGLVELRNVTFGYNKSRPPLIKDFNLTIKPGQRVAVVGSSGSGKSTLLRLMSGISQPWSGEILFDGHLRDEIPEEVLRRSLSVVNQEAMLFAATVRDNITLWNPAVPDEIIVSATRDACIHHDILVRPHGYSTEVEEGGANFSGGQRQRLEIARALVGNPTLLLLDEATSSLDAATEESVDDSLRRRGVTCFIIAHRLSTVRDCDEIIVLEKGAVVQRGTHEKMIADRDGTYYKLVRSG